MSSPARRINDDELVQDIVDGRLTLRQIEEKYRFRPRLLSQVLGGRCRPGLKRKIDDARFAVHMDFRRLGEGMARSIMVKHVQTAMEGEGETARKAREWVMDRFLPAHLAGPAEPPTDPAPAPGEILPGLTASDCLREAEGTPA